MKYVCPSCQRIVYNRRNKDCEFCGKALPVELLLTQAEVEDLDKKHNVLLEAHLQREAEKNKIHYDSDGGGLPIFPLS